jgi:hypothetical protein
MDKRSTKKEVKKRQVVDPIWIYSRVQNYRIKSLFYSFNVSVVYKEKIREYGGQARYHNIRIHK